MTYDTSNVSMVSGLVDFMSTLVSGSGTPASARGRLDKPPPLPPKAHRVCSADTALPGRSPAKTVCIIAVQSVLWLHLPSLDR